MKIALVGECMFENRADCAPVEKNKIYFGGDTVNTAVYLSRLLKGRDAEVYYITRIGDSPRDDGLINALADEAINCSLTEQVKGGITGNYTIHVDPDGERSFTYDRAQAPARELFSNSACFLLDRIAHFDVLYVSGITLAILSQYARQRLLQLMNDMKADGKMVVYDSNHRPLLWENEKNARDTHIAAFQACTVALPSYEDLQLIFCENSKDYFFERFRKMEISQIVLKDGDKGVMLLTDGEIRDISLQKVTAPKDTTGAGDSFNAGFLSVILSGGGISDAVMSGHRLAAKVIMHFGAIIPQAAMVNNDRSN